MSKVEVIQGKAVELDPNKKYIILFSRNDMSMDDAAQVGKALKNIGVTSIGVMVENAENVRIVDTGEVVR